MANETGPVTTGELGRRLDDLKGDIHELKEAIASLKFVSPDLYQAEQREQNRRIDELEEFKKDQQGKPARTLSALVHDLAIPLLLLVVGTVVGLYAQSKGAL